jgi:acylphosphatase
VGESLISYVVHVVGRVQGVYFRASTKQCADALGVTGWVRNEADESVTALIQHSDEAVLKQMIAFLREGPPHARVDTCEVEVARDVTEHGDFRIER